MRPLNRLGLRLGTPQALQDFKHACGTHTETHAHGHADALCAAAPPLDERVTRQSVSAHALGVSHGDGAAVDIQPVHRDPEPIRAVENLHGKGLIQLPKIDVADR